MKQVPNIEALKAKLAKAKDRAETTWDRLLTAEDNHSASKRLVERCQNDLHVAIELAWRAKP